MSEDQAPMTSHRPYLLRALYEWITDNGMTPHLLVDATQPGVRVPPHTVKDGKVVLNIAARAVGHLDLGIDAVAFTGRFGGVSHAVIVPVEAVLAIYARETGQGMALPDDAVSGESGEVPDEQDEPETSADARPSLSAVPASDGDDDDNGPDTPTPTPRRGGHLRIVK